MSLKVFDYWSVERHRFPSSIPNLTNLTTVADSCLVRATKTVAHRVHHSPLTTDRGRIKNLVLGHKTLYYSNSCPASISLLTTRSFPFILSHNTFLHFHQISSYKALLLPLILSPILMLGFRSRMWYDDRRKQKTTSKLHVCEKTQMPKTCARAFMRAR